MARGSTRRICLSGIPAAQHSSEYLSSQRSDTVDKYISSQRSDTSTIYHSRQRSGISTIYYSSQRLGTSTIYYNSQPYITAVSDQISTVSHLLPRRGLQRGACYLLVARAANRIRRSGQTHGHRIVVISHRRQEGASPVGQQSYCAKSRPWRNTATRGVWYHVPR